MSSLVGNLQWTANISSTGKHHDIVQACALLEEILAEQPAGCGSKVLVVSIQVRLW